MDSTSWTFLSNHGHVLIYLRKNPDAKVSEISATVGITDRATHSILNDLENAGYLKKVKIGRRNHYTVNVKAKFRHPAESHQSISQLLAIFEG